MRALALDFTRDRPRLQAWSVALLALGVLALALVLGRAALLRGEIQTLSSELQAAQQTGLRSSRDLQPAAGDAAALAREVAQANQVTASLNLGWSALFRQLETIRVSGVTLLALQPETAAGVRRLRITGEARRLDAALAYVTQLATTAGFANAHLASHEVLADKGGSTIQFVVVVDWGAAP